MPLKDTTLTHPGSSDCQSYAPTEQWVRLGMSGTPTKAASVCTPTKQWAGLSRLGSCSGQRAYAVDIQGCQQHPNPTTLAREPGLARLGTLS